MYIGFSSALGTFNAASLARNTILRDQPDAQIHIVDSLSASAGGGLLVLEAARLAGRSFERRSFSSWKGTSCANHWFTVDDRVSPPRRSAVTFLQCRGLAAAGEPVLHVDNKGRLVPVCKVRGRRKAIDELCRRLVERIDNPAEQTIAISHADCEDDARLLESRIREQVQVRDCIITPIGPAVGAHSGPDTLSLFFWGQER